MGKFLEAIKKKSVFLLAIKIFHFNYALTIDL